MIDAIYLKAHRTATSMVVKRGAWTSDRLDQRRYNTKLHATCDSTGRPLSLLITAGQISDYIGARALLSSLPSVDWVLGD